NWPAICSGSSCWPLSCSSSSCCSPGAACSCWNNRSAPGCWLSSGSVRACPCLIPATLHTKLMPLPALKLQVPGPGPRRPQWVEAGRRCGAGTASLRRGPPPHEHDRGRIPIGCPLADDFACRPLKEVVCMAKLIAKGLMTGKEWENALPEDQRLVLGRDA